MPPIKSQKQLNGLIFDEHFASPCLSSNHKEGGKGGIVIPFHAQI